MNEHVRANKIMVGFLCGAAMGVGIALLTAPSSGRVARRRIGSTARRLVDTTRAGFDVMRGRLGEVRGNLNGSNGSMDRGADDGAAYPSWVRTPVLDSSFVG